MYKRVDTMDVYKTPNISIGTVMKTSETLKLVLEHLKTKKMCKYAVKKFLCLLRHVPDQYKTQRMCNKAILDNV